uniref:Uncharacterized protein LOC113796680 n=1 Tax=Dermatophagoides pteronyssinus TaxID=6956 RepID=A0A6P6YD03_DERPT|nr:uncharacterized protein LOC113796680 [Dermatophagoides pteronyssinus]
MDLLCYNRENGQLDAFLRGFYSKLLKKDTYKKFQECERLDDIIPCLDDTVYEKYFEDEQKFTDIKSFVIQFKRALAEDYKLFCRYASPLAHKFIDYLSYESIIDNIILLLQFSVEERSKPDVINMLDPLGWNNDLELLLHFNGELTELFRIVLFDTPVGPYFERYLELLRDGNSELNFTLDQIDFELMRVCLIRFWLEDYYNFVYGKIYVLSGTNIHEYEELEIISDENDDKSVVKTKKRKLDLFSANICDQKEAVIKGNLKVQNASVLIGSGLLKVYGSISAAQGMNIDYGSQVQVGFGKNKENADFLKNHFNHPLLKEDVLSEITMIDITCPNRSINNKTIKKGDHGSVVRHQGDMNINKILSINKNSELVLLGRMKADMLEIGLGSKITILESNNHTLTTSKYCVEISTHLFMSNFTVFKCHCAILAELIEIENADLFKVKDLTVNTNFIIDGIQKMEVGHQLIIHENLHLENVVAQLNKLISSDKIVFKNNAMINTNSIIMKGCLLALSNKVKTEIKELTIIDAEICDRVTIFASTNSELDILNLAIENGTTKMQESTNISKEVPIDNIILLESKSRAKITVIKGNTTLIARDNSNLDITYKTNLSKIPIIESLTGSFINILKANQLILDLAKVILNAKLHFSFAEKLVINNINSYTNSKISLNGNNIFISNLIDIEERSTMLIQANNTEITTNTTISTRSALFINSEKINNNTCNKNSLVKVNLHEVNNQLIVRDYSTLEINSLLSIKEAIELLVSSQKKIATIS